MCCAEYKLVELLSEALARTAEMQAKDVAAPAGAAAAAAAATAEGGSSEVASLGG